MEIYIEVIILDNLIIDYIILRACGMKEKIFPRWWRCVLASIIGVLVVFISLAEIPNYAIFAVKILSSFLMVFTAFGGRKFFKLLFDFYFFTFAIGGCALGLLYLKEGVNFGVFESVATIPTGVIFGVILLGYIIAKRVIYIWSGDGISDCYTFIVEMQNGEKTKRMKGFLDTGNLLVFGEDLRGVCICEYRHMASFLKGQKPWGHVATQTAVGDDFLTVYKIEQLCVYKSKNANTTNANHPNCGELVCREKDVAVALSKVEISGEFEVLLSARLIY